MFLRVIEDHIWPCLYRCHLGSKESLFVRGRLLGSSRRVIIRVSLTDMQLVDMIPR